MNFSIFLQPDEINGVEYLWEMFQQEIPPASILVSSFGKTVEKSRSVFSQRTTRSYQPRKFSELIRDKDIPCIDVNSINCPTTIDLIKQMEIDVVVYGAGEIVSRRSLESPNLGFVNCHPSDISKYRGCTNVEWAIYEDYPIYLSCHYMTDILDSGPLVLQRKFPYDDNMSYKQLRTEIIRQQAKTMVAGVKRILDNQDMIFVTPPVGEYRHVIKGDKFETVKAKLVNCTYSPARNESECVKE